MKEQILIVDDEPEILEHINHILSGEGYGVKKASNGKAAIASFKSKQFPLVITDLQMPGMGGLEVLKQVKQMNQDTEVIVLTGYATIETAISALRDCQAYDYLKKPLENIEDLIISVDKALEHRRLNVENKYLINELRDANSKLETRVEKRTLDLMNANVQLVNAKEKAEAGIIAKTNFLSSMSHELRTPLNAVIGFSEVLKDRHFGSLTQRQEKYIQEILTSGKHLHSLIEDILNFTQMETGKHALELKNLDLGSFLESIMNSVKDKAQNQGILLDLDISREIASLTFQVDEQSLKQIMLNLLDNSLKFTPQGGQISIIASHSEKFIQISVADSGIGIPLEIQKNIFNAFYQFKGGLAGKTPGTGLGLSIARRLVELHKGRIWVESQGDGKGSTLFFTIPCESNLGG